MVDFVRGSNPVWYFVDLAGIQADDNFYLWVLENDIPYQPASVYQTPTGTVWANPIQFLANGTLPTNIYFNPDETYRLEVRKNDGTAPPSQSDALIYLIENYNPNGSNATPSTADQSSVGNQITNPQFVDINFVSPYTLTGVANPDPIEIAPGWFLELVGNGSVTIEQVPLNNALTTPTNAPYALRLTFGAGWTQSPILRQRFEQNGQLWSEKFVASSYTARIEGASQNVTSRLVASDGTPLLNFGTETVTSIFTEYLGVGEMPATTNADLPPNAYLDFEIVLPQVVDIYLTSLQVLTVNQELTTLYQQTSVNRQIDHTFNYYKPKLGAKPIPSHLIGWDFPRNPAQWGENYAVAAIGANKSDYVWDQTIIFQSQNDGFTVSRDATGAMKVEIEVNSTQIALIQYIEQDIAREILNGRLSVNIAANKTAGTVDGIVSLWYTSVALPDMSAGTNNSIVATLNADGTVATQNGTWTEVPRRGSEDASFTLSTSATNNFNEVMLNGWDLEGSADIDTVTTMAIVVAFESMNDGDIIDVESISLCSGDIATKPAPIDLSTTLKACERYYEKSYAQGNNATDITSVNAVIKPAKATVGDGANIYFRQEAFEIEFSSEKYSATPTISVYSDTTGTVDRVRGIMRLDGAAASATGDLVFSTYWTAISNGDKGSSYQANGTVGTTLGMATVSTTEVPSSYIKFHYIADSRIGIA